jgi:hypothetical protein
VNTSTHESFVSRGCTCHFPHYVNHLSIVDCLDPHIPVLVEKLPVGAKCHYSIANIALTNLKQDQKLLCSVCWGRVISLCTPNYSSCVEILLLHYLYICRMQWATHAAQGDALETHPKTLKTCIKRFFPRCCLLYSLLLSPPLLSGKRDRSGLPAGRNSTVTLR